MEALPDTEDLCISLVREFLAAKGFNLTLLSLDEERPKSGTRLISHQQLAVYLGMGDTQRTDTGGRSKTLLESLVSERLEKKLLPSSSKVKGKTSINPVSPRSAASKPSNSAPYTHFISQPPPEVRAMPTGVGSRHKLGSHKKTAMKKSQLPDFLKDKEEKKTKEPSSVVPTKSTEPVFQKLTPPKKQMKSNSLNATPTIQHSPSHSTTASASPSLSTATKSSKHSPGSKGHRKKSNGGKQKKENLLQDLELSWEAEEGLGMAPELKTSSGAKKKSLTSSYRPPVGVNITLEQGQELREVLFGNVRGSFNKEWLQQNLIFSDVSNLEFGLVQHKGGPCGVLASLQAHVIKHLLFLDEQTPNSSASPRPTPERRCEALVQAMAEILWRAGNSTRATVATLSQVSGRTAMKIGELLAGNDVISKMALHAFDTKGALTDFLNFTLIARFMNSDSSGCICFTVSMVLSKGISNVREDMDDSKSTLIGFHNYCTQELVNLILTGYATSNVFDGEISLGGTGADEVLLRGIRGPTDIGQLSLFEHYGSCKVGDFYKNPKYPIFVVCCESHFVVLFALTRNLIHNRQPPKKFDLYYYDGLANQKDLVRLTVQEGISEDLRDELAPPIELCINTRWKSKIEWNGSEQLL